MRSGDRRQQTDRRRRDGRREEDRFSAPSSQGNGNAKAQPEEKFGNNTLKSARNFISKPAAHALSEDELRFLLDDD